MNKVFNASDAPEEANIKRAQGLFSFVMGASRNQSGSNENRSMFSNRIMSKIKKDTNSL